MDAAVGLDVADDVETAAHLVGLDALAVDGVNLGAHGLALLRLGQILDAVDGVVELNTLDILDGAALHVLGIVVDEGDDGDIYTITIVYDEGESTFSNEAGITLGVEELTQGRLNVMTGRGTVTVSNANGSDVTILTTDGRQVAKADNVDKKTFHVQRGTYLVRVAEHVFHVVVK